MTIRYCNGKKLVEVLDSLGSPCDFRRWQQPGINAFLLQPQIDCDQCTLPKECSRAWAESSVDTSIKRSHCQNRQRKEVDHLYRPNCMKGFPTAGTASTSHCNAGSPPWSPMNQPHTHPSLDWRNSPRCIKYANQTIISIRT